MGWGYSVPDSQRNFAHWLIDSAGVDRSLMYFPHLNPATGKLRALKMLPMQLRNFRLNHASDAAALWLAIVPERESKPFGSSVQLQQDGVLVLNW